MFEKERDLRKMLHLSWNRVSRHHSTLALGLEKIPRKVCLLSYCFFGDKKRIGFKSSLDLYYHSFLNFFNLGSCDSKSRKERYIIRLQMRCWCVERQEGGMRRPMTVLKDFIFLNFSCLRNLLRKSWKSYSINRGLMLSQGVLPFPKCSTP